MTNICQYLAKIVPWTGRRTAPQHASPRGLVAGFDEGQKLSPKVTCGLASGTAGVGDVGTEEGQGFVIAPYITPPYSSCCQLPA